MKRAVMFGVAALAGVILAAAPVFAAQGAQVSVGTTLDFTPVPATPGGTVSWALPTSDWNYDDQVLTQFTVGVYTYNNNMINQWRQIMPLDAEGGFPGAGGIVWHFKSSSVATMNLLLNLTYYWGNWGGHTFEVYFSDENNWDGLKYMVGGVWDGGSAWTGFETNPLWTRVYSNRLWGSDGEHALSLPVTTTDGEFWVRVDMSCTAGGVGFNTLMAMNVQGTVAAENLPQWHQVFVGKTLDFTPASSTPGSTVGWTMPTSTWNYDPQLLTQFATDVYSFNSNMVNQWRQIQPLTREGSYPGCGGTVWHFKSATAQPMDLTITGNYYWGNWGGHTFEIYISDDNNWDNIKTMVGGVWDGSPEWDGFEHNPLWTGLYTNRMWGSDGFHDVSVPASTTDGDFWVRIDMSGTDGGVGFSSLTALSVNGTIVNLQQHQPGDANGDGKVDVSDLGILAANYGAVSGAVWAQGDFNGDGKVDVSDLGILAANYGFGTGASLDFNQDAKAFGLEADAVASKSETPVTNTLGCGSAGLPLLAGLLLAGLLLSGWKNND